MASTADVVSTVTCAAFGEQRRVADQVRRGLRDASNELRTHRLARVARDPELFADHVAERAVRDRGSVRLTTDGQDVDAVEWRDRLVDQPGLAEAEVAGDDRDAIGHAVPAADDRAELCELRVAPDERELVVGHDRPAAELGTDGVRLDRLGLALDRERFERACLEAACGIGRAPPGSHRSRPRPRRP